MAIGTILAVGLITGAVVFGGVLVTVGWVVGSYNTMIIAQQDIKTMWSNVKTEYQRRADLFINLATAAKAYLKHEKDTLTQVIQARNGLTPGLSKQAELMKLKGLEGLFSKLAVVFEKYPDLKADKTIKDLMYELKETENRVNIARTDYNSVVRDYNILIKVFPRNFLADLFRFKEELFFEVDDKDAFKAPKIQL